MTKNKTAYVVAKDRIDLSVGDVVKMTCELNDISQAELSRLSGISPSNLSDIIHDRRPVGKMVAEKIAKALNVSPAFILFGGATPRKGSDTTSDLETRKGFLLLALRKLKEAEKKRSEAHPAMRNAIILITRALYPDPTREFEPLIESSLLAERAPSQRIKVKHHR